MSNIGLGRWSLYRNVRVATFRRMARLSMSVWAPIILRARCWTLSRRDRWDWGAAIQTYGQYSMMGRMNSFIFIVYSASRCTVKNWGRFAQESNSLVGTESDRLKVFRVAELLIECDAKKFQPFRDVAAAGAPADVLFCSIGWSLASEAIRYREKGRKYRSWKNASRLASRKLFFE